MPTTQATITAGSSPSTCADLGKYQNISGGILAQVSDADLGTDGLLTQAGASTVIGKLRTSKFIPTPPDLTSAQFANKTWQAPGVPLSGGVTKDELAKYVEDQNAMIANIEVEYNYVKAFYTKSVSCLVDEITKYTSENDSLKRAAINSNITTFRTKSIDFNKKLNLLLDISRKISETLLADSQTYETQINTYNAQFTQRKANLEEQARILKSEDSASELHKRMVDYTAEKNRAHNNLLTLYSCLNIVAIAMLFYIAK